MTTTISIIVTQGKISYQDLVKFLSEAAESYFLFGEEIPQYIDKIYKKGVRLDYTIKQLDNSSLTVEQRGKIADENRDLLQWFVDQLTQARLKSAKYLSLMDRF